MRRNTVLYAILATVIFVCFLSFLENKKANASLGFRLTENQWIIDQWVVARVVDQKSQKEVTEKYSLDVWEFLSSNGFVQFRDRVIEGTGGWTLNNGIITIQRDGEDKKQIFKIESAGRNELILSGEELKIRLLKLE